MKTIIFKENNLSAFIFDDDHIIDLHETHVSVTSPWGAVLTIGNMNNVNCIVYENVTPPTDWKQARYFYDGSTWLRDPFAGEP